MRRHIPFEAERLQVIARARAKKVLSDPDRAESDALLAWNALRALASAEYSCDKCGHTVEIKKDKLLYLGATAILDRLLGKPETKRVVKLENDYVLSACVRAVSRFLGEGATEEFVQILAQELGIEDSYPVIRAYQEVQSMALPVVEGRNGEGDEP